MIPWLHFTTGLIVGCWAGALVGGGIALLFAGRRLRQLEAANMLMRIKLRARDKDKDKRSAAFAGGASVIVMSPRETQRPASAPTRMASGDR